ncbi:MULTISPECIES: hypothetical protein [Klebsiella]|uniref:hypothetical protein n=1 Tax=Klebsiella TaxID=570 RepID=UPI001D0CF640|nr:MULTISPECIES: hypothetical protein [Klebsiella]MCS6686260.1 hypothetical protein [Klebsiella pneumoniae subsp. pneumoniae]
MLNSFPRLRRRHSVISLLFNNDLINIIGGHIVLSHCKQAWPNIIIITKGTSLMIVKCEDVFVNSLTGEIINPLDYCLPEGYDVSPAVTEALTGLPLKGTYTTTGEIKKGKGRKPKVLVNKYCSLFQNLERKDVRTTTGEIKSVAILPSVIDDVVTGALRLNEGGDNTTVPRNQLLFVLAHLETLSVESIQSLFTAKRELKGDAAPGISYCRYILRKCESVINSLSYHIERGNFSQRTSFDFAQDAKDYEKYGCVPSCVISPAPFTKGDKEIIRKLAIEGKLIEADKYVKAVSDAQDKLMKKFSAPTLKQIEAEMNAEFPYDPYIRQY